MNLNCEFPINGLSFGAIAHGITTQLFERGISPNIFPIGNPDLSVYDKASEDYKLWLQGCLNKATTRFKKDFPGLKLWHITNSWHKISNKQSLLTFFELDQITDTEKNILNQQDKIFVTSTETKQVFEDYGVTVPVIYTPMGFDPIHFKRLNKQYFNDGSIVFSLFGKFEKRKHTEKVVRNWVKRFGGDRRYRLHLHIHNVFYNEQQIQATYQKMFDGKNPPFNVQIYPFLKNNSLLNDAFNVTNIVLDMSGGESISLPSLHCVALGKHAVIHHCSAMKDWTNEQNAVLVQSNGKELVYDGVFFNQGNQFNQGNIYTWDENEFIAACEKAIQRYEANPVNEAGFELQEKYSFKGGVDIILKEIN
ncbi:MAG: hypothetical protein Q8O88_02025 [bacterium]|nr:hypothetical protein [bacterium]